MSITTSLAGHLSTLIESAERQEIENIRKLAGHLSTLIESASIVSTAVKCIFSQDTCPR